MAVFKVGIIGCGGRGKSHARGYAASKDAKIFACADPNRENAAALAKEHKIPKSRIYADYKKMLAKVKPDIVSICTWTGLHAQMVIDSVESDVKAIHAEKPMAPTWGESKKLYQACVDNSVMITFCHQRRFGATFVKAKELANDGAIGELHRVEGYCSNLFDWGTHWFDMFFFYNNDRPAEWVMGQINWEEEHSAFGVPVETHGLSYVKWKNGVYGHLVTGRDAGGRCSNRLIGTKGVIELNVPEGPPLRVMHEGSSGWEVPNLKGVVPPGGDTTLSVLDLIDCLKTGREPVLSGRKALQATELIFATYESSRRRARIYLPLEIEDSPLISMLEAGAIGPKRKD
jgi:UDP-N-acetylglucosamine 3-dehydrogenase